VKPRRGSLSSGGGKTASDLEGVVDDPLKAGEGTNHEDSGTETLPESSESNLSIDLLDLGHGAAISSLSLVEDGDHGVSWMRDESAEHTGNVSGHESDHQLGRLAVGVLWLGEDGLVELLHDLLEGDELDNGVWNLSGPEWLETLVESVVTLGGLDLLETSHGGGWELSPVGGLHFNLQLYLKIDD
jgi:hypothetical protein